ncbi:hypothetical protein QYF36_007284 [Acer negundo]|nr:hypothetical protein QYF36_007284 [Acer negundo]
MIDVTTDSGAKRKRKGSFSERTIAFFLSSPSTRHVFRRRSPPLAHHVPVIGETSHGLSFSHSSLKLPAPLSAVTSIIPSNGAAVVAALSLAATAHSCTARCQVAQEGSRVRQATATSLYI